MDYGYARVSTTQQDLDRQLDALTKAGIDNKRIYSDKKSGATADRPGLIDVLDRLRSGDVLVVYTLDRLGRTVRDVLNHIHELRAAGIGLRTLADAIPIDTSKPGDAISELAIVLLSLSLRWNAPTPWNEPHTHEPSAKNAGNGPAAR